MIAPIPYCELTPEKARAGCFVCDMPNETYHAYEGISASGLNLVERSPAHYAAREERETTRFMEIGNAIHCALLEPSRYEREYLETDHPNRTCAGYREDKKLQGGEFTLTEVEVKNVRGMQRSAYANPDAAKVLKAPGWTELSAFATDPITGVLIRCRFDKLTALGEALDIKKTQDARDYAFSKSIHGYGYHAQMAFYNHVYKSITGSNLAAFKFLAIEEKPPHCCVLYELDATAEAIGWEQAETNLRRYAQCVAADRWPGYEMTAAHIGLPAWVVNRYEDEQEVTL